MHYNKCCVPGCASSRQDAFLHKFPVCEKRLRKWLELINCETLRSLNINELNKLLVCHRHFEQRFVTSNSRLLSIAYPTLFLESEIRNGTPINSSEEDPWNPLVDHTYAKEEHKDHTYSKDPSRLPTNTVGQVKPSTSQDVVQVSVDPVPTTSQDIHIDQISETMKHVDHCSYKDPSADPQAYRKRKLVDNVATLTPKCRKIYNAYRNSRKLMSFKRRCKKAIDFSKKEYFEEKVLGMNPFARKIFDMQINMCKKKITGRRFTLEEKLIALFILKQGPKSYRFLQKNFILPSLTTLKKLVSRLNLTSGINPKIFACIKEEVETWQDEKKYCSIIFDEMALEMSLTYTFKDEICGFTDLIKNKNQFADHALVFMIKGVVHKWQQPIAYYFCKGSTPGVELKRILIEIVTAVGETGLIPIALISDQGASFQSTLKRLKEDTRREQIIENKDPDGTIKINDHQLHVIFDPPHLIKGLRNNFLTKNIAYDNKISKWADIVDVYQTDCQHTETRLLHKLSDEHVIPDKIKKMKVKNCVRVFSKTMAAALNFTSAFSHYSDGKPVSVTLRNTAEIVSFFDDLFDSVNGTTVFNKKRKGKTLRSAVRSTSDHHNFWAEAIKKLEKIKFIDKNGSIRTVPSLMNWMSTLKSFQKLWRFLKERNIKIMRPRYLNSDAIENYFGQVRAYNFRDNNPTCHNFQNTFKSLLITGLIKFHNTTFNCENDQSDQILKIRSLFDHVDNSSNLEMKNSETNKSFIESHPVVMEARQQRLNIQSRAYTAGSENS